LLSIEKVIQENYQILLKAFNEFCKGYKNKKQSLSWVNELPFKQLPKIKDIALSRMKLLLY
jgi:hypothetical protein